MIIVRLADDMIDIDGQKAILHRKSNNWFSPTGNKLSLIQLQNLYLFLDEERLAKRRIFYRYVDRVINKLIYNK